MSESGNNLLHTIAAAELGPELLLLSLFLIGFAVFRVSLLRHTLDGRWRKPIVKGKSDAAAELVADIVAATKSETNIEQPETQSKPTLQSQPCTSVTSSPEERTQLLCRHAVSRSPRALELFEETILQADCKLTESGLASLVAACAESRHVQLAERCAEYGREEYGKLTLELYGSLMRIYTHASLFRKICELDEAMRQDDVKPDDVACAMLIKAHGQGRHADRVWALWAEAVACGNDGCLNEDLFANMVEACILCGDLDGVATVLRQALPAMDAFTRGAPVVAAVMKACVQGRRLQLAVELYHELKETITCTKGTYNTMIDAFVRQGDMGTATELFRDMALQGVGPDLFIYSALIKGHCLGGDLEKGLQLLGLMQRRGIAPDAVLFNSILDGCAHKQMRTLTETVLKDMERAGVVPSNHTLSILVKLYGRCGDLTAAFDVVDVYPKKFGFPLNVEVYNCLMSACIANEDQVRALSVYDTMIASGCMVDAKCYQTLLKGCVQHGDVDGAHRIVNDVFGTGDVGAIFSASSDRQTLEGILLMAVRQGRSADVALPMLQRLQDVSITVSDRTCSAVRGR